MARFMSQTCSEIKKLFLLNVIRCPHKTLASPSSRCKHFILSLVRHLDGCSSVLNLKPVSGGKKKKKKTGGYISL